MHSKLSEQMIDLERKTRSLEMLYDFAAGINVSRDLDDLFSRSLQTLAGAIGANHGVVRLLEGENNLRLATTIGFTKPIPQRRKVLDSKECICNSVIRKGHIQIDAHLKTCCGQAIGEHTNDPGLRLLCVPLQYQSKVYGVMNLFIKESSLKEEEDLIVLLTSIGQHLGMAIERTRLEKETERLYRVEQRQLLAHELHDSLAQTLASLRFHAHILGENVSTGDNEALRKNISEIEKTVDIAYRELRDLIARFRLSVDEPGLVPSVQAIIQRFREESEIQAYFDNDLEGIHFSEDTELQVARIVQEALNNVTKHSHAKTVRIMMKRTSDDECRVLIEDDGKGFSPNQSQPESGEHLGMIIMQERAARIGGKLSIESEPEDGTRLELLFRHKPSSE